MNRSCAAHSLALALLTAFVLALAGSGWVSADDAPLPRIVGSHGRYELLVDGKPYLILGAQVNNSSNYPAILPEVWPATAQMHANTVVMPIASELTDVSYRGDLFGVAEDSAVHVQTIGLAARRDMFSLSVKLGVKDWVGPGYPYGFYDPFSQGAREPDMISNTTLAEREALMSPTPLGPGLALFRRTFRIRWVTPQARPGDDFSAPQDRSVEYAGAPIQIHCQSCNRGERTAS